MAVTCEDLTKFVHPYIDGEFSDDERDDLERHLAACEGCRGRVAYERRFKSALGAKLAPPSAPAGLRARITMALDREDVDAEARPSRWQWTLPVASLAAAAAAIALFVVYPYGRPPVLATGVELDPSVLVAEHPQPVEVEGPVEMVSQRLEREVGIPVRPPRFGGQPQIHFARARVNRLPGVSDRTARLEYLLNAEGGQRRITVQVFDASRIRGVRAMSKRRINGRDVYYASSRGYSVAFFEANGVGYAITADVSPETLDRLVTAELSQR